MPPRGTIVCFLCRGIVSYKNKDTAKFEKHMKNEHMANFGMEYLLAGCTMSEEERLAIKDVIKERIEENEHESDQNTTLEEDAEVKTTKIKTKEETKTARFQCDDCPISFTQANNLEEHVARKHKKKADTNNTKSKAILEAIDRKNAIDGEFSKTMKTFKSGSDSLKTTNIATITSKSEPKANLEKVVQGLSTKKLKAMDISIKKDGEEVEVKRKNSTSTSPVPKSKNGTCISIKKDGEEVEVKRKNLTSTIPVPKSKKNGKGGSNLIAEPGQEPGEGTVCPLCSKEFPKNGPMRSHFVDIHQPGEFPCPGCQKVFTSKNKMSSHYSRNCKRKTL